MKDSKHLAESVSGCETDMSFFITAAVHRLVYYWALLIVISAIKLCDNSPRYVYNKTSRLE